MPRYSKKAIMRNASKSVLELNNNKIIIPASREIIPSEHEEQVDFVEWFEREFPSVGILAIPNGGHRHKATAYKLKKEGVKKGVPDLLIPEWFLWVEMKRIKNSSLSDDQKKWRDYLVSVGYEYRVCKGCQAAIAAVLQFLRDNPRFHK